MVRVILEDKIYGMQRFRVHSNTLERGQRAQSKPQRAGNTKLSPFFLYVRIFTDTQCAPHTQPVSALGRIWTRLTNSHLILDSDLDGFELWPRNNTKDKTPKGQNVET